MEQSSPHCAIVLVPKGYSAPFFSLSVYKYLLIKGVEWMKYKINIVFFLGDEIIGTSNFLFCNSLHEQYFILY